MADLSINLLLPWFWIALAILFLVAEILTSGFVLLCFGIGAFIGAAIAFLGGDMAWQVGAFVVGSGVSVFLLRPFAERVSVRGVQQIAIDRVLGKRAMVLQTIDPERNTGMVRVDSEEWRAESVDHRIIPEGSLVEVLAVDGVRLQVRPAPIEDGLAAVEPRKEGA